MLLVIKISDQSALPESLSNVEYNLKKDSLGIRVCSKGIVLCTIMLPRKKLIFRPKKKIIFCLHITLHTIFPFFYPFPSGLKRSMIQKYFQHEAECNYILYYINKETEKFCSISRHRQKHFFFFSGGISEFSVYLFNVGNI